MSLVSHYKFENDYADSVGSNTLSAAGSGNSFSTALKNRGAYSLQMDGSGWAIKTGQTGFGSGNIDLSFGGWGYFTTGSRIETIGGFGVNSAINSSCIWSLKLSATSIRIDLASDALAYTVPSISDTTWYWWWVQYTASTKTSDLYLNNTQSSSGAQTHSTNLNLNATTDINVAVDPDGSNSIIGNVDDWRAYNSVTTAAERLGIYVESSASVLLNMLHLVKEGSSPMYLNGLLPDKWVYSGGLYTRPAINIRQLERASAGG